MRRWEELRVWWQERRHKRGIIAGVVCVLVLFLVFIDLVRPGGKLWYTLSVRDTLNTCELKKGQYCSDYKETSDIYGDMGCYATKYGVSNKIFEEDLKFILYGKIEKVESYVIEGDKMRNGKKIKPVPYYCHVITLRVRRGIYGGVRWNQRVNLLCKWKYVKPERDGVYSWKKIEPGKNALFLVGGNATKIQDGEQSINILGKVSPRRGSFLVETDELKGLSGLRSKKETIAYYKKEIF